MSYSCTIGFKTIKPDEIFSFLVKFKKETITHFEDIAETEYMWHPLAREFHYTDIDEVLSGKKKHEYMYSGADWAETSVFKFRWFYIAKYNLLGIFSIDKCMNYLFDNVSYFQNSCDQDYDFADWKGIPVFEEIATKWKNATEEWIKNIFYVEWHDEDDTIGDFDYWRRSYCYDEIWGMVSKYLDDEESVVYFSLFGKYELSELVNFSVICMKKYQNWIHELQKKKEV